MRTLILITMLAIPAFSQSQQSGLGLASSNQATIPYTAASGTSAYISGLTPDLSAQNLASSVVIDVNQVMPPADVQSYLTALAANPDALRNAQGLTSQLRGGRVGGDEQVIGYSMGRVITVKSNLFSQFVTR